MKLGALDLAVLFVYLAGIAGIGLWLSRGLRTTRQFFTADRQMPAWVVTFALMATVISSGSFVGHPGTAFEQGLILLLPQLSLPVVLLVVARWIVPFYRRTVRMSAYEYLGHRFGLGGRVYASLGFLADRVFDLAVTLVTTAIALYVLTGWPAVNVVVGVGLFTLVYTMLGGITAVAWTNVAQGVIFSTAALYILVRVLFAPEIGDAGAILRASADAGRYSLGSFDFSWDQFRGTGTPSFWVLFFAYSILWARRYVADQHIVQHYLIARTDRAASRGAFLGAFTCLPVFAAFMFIGATLHGFFELHASDPGPARADEVMPYFLARYIPTGAIGAILAAILAAGMSSVAADLNSIATVLTTDYFTLFRPGSSEAARLRFGRAMVVAGGVLATLCALWLIPGEDSAPVMLRGVTIATIISGGSLGLFCLGFLTRRATRTGAFVGIAACLLFTAWALLSQPGGRVVDFGFNWELNPILIGVAGHFVLFGVGWLASVLLGGYRPDDVERLTIRHRPPPTDATSPLSP